MKLFAQENSVKLSTDLIVSSSTIDIFYQITLFTKIGTKFTFFTKIATKFTFFTKIGTKFTPNLGTKIGTKFRKKCQW